MKSLEVVFFVVVAVLWSLGQSQTFPYVSFMGQTLANHSYADLSLVGTSVSDSVQCHTDLATCCSRAQGPHRGDWYFPNGERLLFAGQGNNIYEKREAQRVDLRRSTGATIMGIYHCNTPTSAFHATGTYITVHVGLYIGSEGILKSIVEVRELNSNFT